MSQDNKDNRRAGTESPCGRLYEICIEGKLDASWAEWFEGLDLKECGERCTVLFGRIPDQAALLGILNRLCGLNIPLVSVQEVDEKQGERESVPPGGAPT